MLSQSSTLERLNRVSLNLRHRVRNCTDVVGGIANTQRKHPLAANAEEIAIDRGSLISDQDILIGIRRETFPIGKDVVDVGCTKGL